MRTSVVIGYLVAVVCFVTVESRALSSLEVNANQVNPAESAQQVSFQGQSDDMKQKKDKKAGQADAVYYPGYEHPGYPWHYGQYSYQHPGYLYPYSYPYTHPAVHPAVQPAAPPPAVTVHPAVTVQHPATHTYPYGYPYPYHYPSGYNYPYGYNCGYPGCESHTPEETTESSAKEEPKKEGNDKEDKKSAINH